MSDQTPGARLTAMLERIPYARFLGVRSELAGDEMTMILPFGQHIIGNPVLPAIHGGVLGAFMEMTALAQLSLQEGQARQPRVIDVSIDYLRSGRPLTTYARADIKKVGRRIANVHVEAWQEQRAQPIAALRAHFLLGQGDA
ncbi:MAG TPA: PaaI family thioesterase [Caulobacter sp.]|nr:PaaI family thioesterase [Caulobacter sp.]